MSEPLLFVEDLHVSYGASMAVKGVSFSVPQGGIVSLLGPNGAGKTSTLRAIVGLVRRRTGNVRFAGDSVTRLATETIAARGLVLVPEGRHIFPTMTVKENLIAGASARRDRSSLGSTMDALFDRFAVLRARSSQHAGNLSGGEQQQLAIARALMSRPRMLLLDEPSLGLAPIMVRQVFSLLRELKAEDVTMLLVEQNAAQALRLADNGHVMLGGRIVQSGSASELSASDEIADVYFGAGGKDASQ